MALLGAQLVITLVMVSLIQKIGLHFSFARWLLCSTGLIRYLYPTNAELRQLANVPKEKPKGKKGGKHTDNGKTSEEPFHVPRNLDITLETAKVGPLDVIHLRYYTEYQWLLDFALYSTVVYILTEIYHNFFPPQDEVNLSMMWCCLVLGFSTKILISLTVQYFKGEESVGERSTCIVMGFTYLLLAMMVLIVDERILELNIENAYTSFNESASVFLNNQGLASTGPASKIVLKFFLALWCGILGALFTFPGLRVAKMHWDLLRCYKERKLIQFLLNVTMAFPFLLVILWVKPVSRDYLTVRVFSGLSEPLMTTYAFESLRLIMVIAAVLIRLALMPLYLQAYLDMAHFRIEEQKKEAGRILNTDLQKKVAAVFYYLCVVTLQYIAPLITCLYFTFIYKTLGGYTWDGFFNEPVSHMECSADFSPSDTETSTLNANEEESISQSAQQFHLALESLKSVFSVEVFRGLFGFATWWTCFVWFGTTSVGMIYQSYFTNT